jgi:RimJ/RimL family protein N-acetyltransferase
MFKETQVTLKGLQVILRPLLLEDAKALFELAEGKPIWRFFPDKIQSQVDMDKVVSHALQEREQGLCLPFTITDKSSGKILGSSRFFNISVKDRRLEMGWTWIGPAWQGKGVNLETKYLMLAYAFEQLNAVRVELKTDHRNEQSQNAMRKFGFVYEGTLRSHIITHDGFLRDSVYFSAIAKDWPDFKKKIEARLTK